MSQQLTLSFDADLAMRYRCLRDVVAAGAYPRTLQRVAADIDMAPSNLSSALSGDGRCLSVDQLEKYIEKTGDVTPIHYLVARFIGSNAEQLIAARDARIEAGIAELLQLVSERKRRK